MMCSACLTGSLCEGFTPFIDNLLFFGMTSQISLLTSRLICFLLGPGRFFMIAPALLLIEVFMPFVFP